MTRRKTVLCTTCFLGVTSFVTYAWTQQPAPTPSAASEDFLAKPDLPTAPVVVRQYDVETTARIENVTAPPVASSPRTGVYVYGTTVGQMRPKTVSETVHRVIWEQLSAEENEQNQAFKEAIQALKDSKDDEAKKKATNTVRDQLTKQFERDLAEREKELAAVEERLRSLRQQLEKRKASKDDIIGLRLKTIVNNAEGLGFPGEDGLTENVTAPAGPQPSTKLFSRRTFDAAAGFSPPQGQSPDSSPRK
jgi:hypothetical protein